MTENLLSREISPYLLQHKDNPVHWMAWGEPALEAARATGKPILLSVGYAACHWCHVMAHESFEDAATADVMNELFVNIKVDREERPDVDAIYQSALAMLGEQGGWPLTMFLTPDGDPFWGGTYYPPTARYGRPAFADVLRGVAKAFREDPARVQQNVDGLREGLAKLSAPTQGALPDGSALDQMAQRILREVDGVHGGIGGAPKFPQPSIMEQLWRAWLRTGQDGFRTAVLVSLNNMCQGGIYDHIGGGFARYAVDAYWLVPHFEKMLYDNAQLIELLTLAWQETQNPLYAERIAETIDWAVREMRNDRGGFNSSLDADSEGEEGRFYVWSSDDVAALLGEDATDFLSTYDITPGGNWEGKSIPNRLSVPQRLDEETEARLAANRATLLEARAARIRPGLDDKVLADWNGLMIRALARAGFAFDRPDWVVLARDAFDFVVAEMQTDGRLAHSWCQGTARHPASLDDYANMASAALALYEIAGTPDCIEQALAWLETVRTHYGDPDGSGFFFSADDTQGLVARLKNANDSAVPSGNGTLVELLARLHALTGDDTHRQAAERQITAFSGEIARNFFGLSTLLNGVDLLLSPVQVVVVGPSGDPETDALIRAAAAPSLPNRILTRLTPDAVLPDTHPAFGKTMIDGRPTAYVCIGPVCSAPLADPDALQARLADMRSAHS